MIQIDNVIMETNNFTIATICNPHIDRMDGGHIVIICKNVNYKNLTDMPIDIAEDLMRLTILCGNIMKEVLNSQGIDVELINYQVNGNWSVDNKERDPVHMHLYGRAKSAVHQKYGEALFFPNPNTGFYDDFLGLTKEDILIMQSLMCNNKSDELWGI